MNVSFCLLPLLPSEYLCLSPFVLQTKGLCFLVHGVEDSCQQQFPNWHDTTIERDYIVPLPCFSRFSGKGLRVPRLECPLRPIESCTDGWGSHLCTRWGLTVKYSNRCPPDTRVQPGTGWGEATCP